MTKLLQPNKSTRVYSQSGWHFHELVFGFITRHLHRYLKIIRWTHGVICKSVKANNKVKNAISTGQTSIRRSLVTGINSKSELRLAKETKPSVNANVTCTPKKLASTRRSAYELAPKRKTIISCCNYVRHFMCPRVFTELKLISLCSSTRITYLVMTC